MAATKQFLLNYDSNILLPYTTLDCILGKEDDESTATGIDVITDKLLENIKEFAYNKDSGLTSNQIKGDDIKTAYVLGISTLKKDSSTQVYTKFHALSLDSPKHSGQYLGADGTNHDIKFSAESKAKDNWYSTSITVEPSGILDDPIKADVSIYINISNDCFGISDGQLYSKYSTRSTSSNVAKLSRCTLNKIVKDDSTNWDASTGIYEELESFGQNVPVQLTNGKLRPITSTYGLGNDLKPIYINNEGEIKQSVGQAGGVNKPIYMDAGQFIQCTQTVGTSSQPMYYDGSSGFVACSGDAGAEDKLGYIEHGVFKTSTTTVGENLKLPMYMENGELKKFTKRVSLIDDAPVGFSNDDANSAQPVFVDSSGIIKTISATVCEEKSNSLLALNGGIFSKQSGNAGGPTRPIFLSSGTIYDSSATVGDLSTPVYLDEGTIKACDIEPQSIRGAKYAGQYLMSDASGVGKWGPGNTTTAGSFNNNDGSVYYLVGINTADASTDGSFTHLTGARKSDGTGIYFKNYELFQTSDENLKTFTDEIDINFDNLATIKKGIYHWTDDPNKISDIGIGARSLEALYPEIVDENDGVKTIAYNRLGVIALAAIDKLHLRVKELETEMKELKAEIRALKQGK